MFWPNVAHASNFAPPQASTFAESWDAMYEFLIVASVISCILVIGGMILFAYKYRRKTDNDKTAYIPHNGFLEFLWSFIPFLIFMFVFAWGLKLYYDMRIAPKDALEVHVVGQKWNWDFIYKSGRRVSNEFYVPVNEPVKMIMQSRDVLHSFFIPSFRVKQDVVPGRYTQLWFEATKEGVFNVFCTEFCGDRHSAMLAKVHVLPREKYDEWLQNDPYKGLGLAEIGQAAFTAKCAVCHNANTTKLVGPGLAQVFGSQRRFEGGGSAEANEDYIRESMLNPGAKVVEGFPNAMTSFQGNITEQEILGLIEYIKSLK